MQPYANFRIKGNVVSCQRYGNGHINKTYLVKTDVGNDYILQKINRRVFHDVPQLMANIAGVTRHLAAKDPDPRHVLTLVSTLSDEDYLFDGAGYWRLYDFVTDSICLDRAETADDCYHSGAAFGRFQNQLTDYRAETLFETILTTTWTAAERSSSWWPIWKTNLLRCSLSFMRRLPNDDIGNGRSGVHWFAYLSGAYQSRASGGGGG